MFVRLSRSQQETLVHHNSNFKMEFTPMHRCVRMILGIMAVLLETMTFQDGTS